MNESKAVCPRCKSEVQFERQGSVARCPVCAFQYQQHELPPLGSFRSDDDLARDALIKFIKVAAIGVLILLGVATVALGVLFVGCVL